MVNFNALSKAMQQEITKIMAGDGADAKKIDSRNEYDQLSKLLSGASGADEKSYIENLMFKYEEEYEVSPGTRQAVAEIIERRSATTADLKSEIDDLKAYKKEHKKELSDADKKYIDDVIKGKAITLAKAEGTQPDEAVKPEPPVEEKEPPVEEPVQEKPVPPSTSPYTPDPTPPAPPTVKPSKPKNHGIGNDNKGNGNGNGNVGNGNNNRGNAGGDINVGPGGANGDNNHTQVGNQINQQGVGIVNGEGNSVNINTPSQPDKIYRERHFGL